MKEFHQQKYHFVDFYSIVMFSDRKEKSICFLDPTAEKQFREKVIVHEKNNWLNFVGIEDDRTENERIKVENVRHINITCLLKIHLISLFR